MHASLCFGLRNPLYTVNARLIFHCSIYIFARNSENNFFVTSRCSIANIGNIYFPTFCFTVFCVHSEKVARKNGRFVTTGSATNFYYCIFIIFRIGRNQQQLDILFHFRNFRFYFINFCFGHFPHFGIGFRIHKLFSFFQMRQRSPVFLLCFHDAFQFAILFVEFHVTFHVTDYGRVGN